MSAFTPPPVERYVAVTAVVVAGPLIWALHLGLVYATSHTACKVVPGQASSIIDWTVAVATVMAALGLVGIIMRPTFFKALSCNDHTFSRNATNFLLSVCRALAVLSLVAVLWTGAAMFFLSNC